MAKEATFNFVPAQLEIPTKRCTDLIASLNTKTGRLCFSVKSIESKAMVGKYLKFSIDKSKKALGWQVCKQETGFDKLKFMHQVQEQKQKGKVVSIYVSVKRYLSVFNIPAKKNFKKMLVEKYKPQGLLNDGDYFYVILK